MLFRTSQLSDELVPNGFVRKGSAFFRVYGDGVLQVLKFEKWRNGCVELQIGLHSMYSELLPQWFTSNACIPQYSIMNVVKQRYVPFPVNIESNVNNQLQILMQVGIPWLNSIKTQKELIDGICFLETSWGGSIQWVDALKIAPYLFCRNYSAAEQVLVAILGQHRAAYEENKEWFTEDEYQAYLRPRLEEDTVFEILLEITRQHDETSINKYLLSNYTRNISYAKFILKGRIGTGDGSVC